MFPVHESRRESLPRAQKQEKNMSSQHPRYSAEETARRGDDIYGGTDQSSAVVKVVRGGSMTNLTVARIFSNRHEPSGG
jgi:hypothetical protein